jgi:hypothetical protein
VGLEADGSVHMQDAAEKRKAEKRTAIDAVILT